MYTKINSQDSLELVTLEQVKRQCNLMESIAMDDEYLNSLIPVCSELAQSYTKRLLTLGSVTTEVEQYYPQIILPWGGVESVTEVLIDGVATTAYTFSDVTQKVTFASGVRFNNVRITYDCGYSTDNLPTKIKHAVLMMVSTMYRNRDDFVVGMTVESMPLQSKTLLNGVKYYAA